MRLRSTGLYKCGSSAPYKCGARLWPLLLTFPLRRLLIKRFALYYRTVVYCGQTVAWIKMTTGMEVGLGPGHTVLECNPAPPPQNRHSPPIFCPCLLWPNDWIDQDATWHGDRPWPRPNKKGHSPHYFRTMSVVAKGLHGLGYHSVRK